MKVTITNNDVFAVRVRYAKPSVVKNAQADEGTGDLQFGFDEVDLAPGESMEFTHDILDVFSLDPALDIPGPRTPGIGND